MMTRKRKTPQSKRLGRLDLRRVANPVDHLSYREDKVMIKYDRESRKTSEHIPEVMIPRPHSNGLVVFRISERWHPKVSTYRRNYAVPYIDRSGLIYASTLCVWKCTSHQLFATIVATVYKRLRSLLNSIPNRKKRVRSDLLMKIATHYAYTNDDIWYKRCLSMMFTQHRQLRSFVYYTLKQVDANKGFLYDQVFSNTSWFKRQSRSPRNCDKSTPDDRTSSTRVYTPRGDRRMQDSTKELNFSWSRVYHVANEKVEYLKMIGPPYGKGSSIFRGKI